SAMESNEAHLFNISVSFPTTKIFFTCNLNTKSYVAIYLYYVLNFRQNIIEQFLNTEMKKAPP
ncbi:hypothetical protein, partial [Virgibacillus halodenitrificans]|uniref:hypothetical protein n=1 Tax=Virgibacillus halodenitrificans TaxID=1482 RepID=UPI001CB90501